MKKMVKRTFILVIAFVLSSTLQAQKLNCSKYYPLQKGATFELTNYNRKGKINSLSNYKVKNVVGKKATLLTKISNRKGKHLMDTEYDVSCVGNGISISFKSLLSSDILKQYEGMTIDVKGTDINLPNNLKTGQKLPDANMNATIDASIMKVKMNFSITNRVVKAKESITTPAGTFTCYVITNDFSSKTMGINSSGTSKQWIADGVGLVKSEEYNKKGKLISYSELTKLNK